MNLTIKEFAKQAGVSTQAIYQRLSKDLAPYLQVANGKKTLDDAALALFSDKQNKQVDCASVNKSLQEESKSLQDAITLELIKTLQEQLAEKDKQLAEKDRQLEAAAVEKMALLERLKDAQQAELQAHALHAGTMQTALIESSAGTDHTEKPAKGWKAWFKRSR